MAKISKIELSNKEKELIITKRKNKGFSSGDISKLIDMTPSNYRMFETGTNLIPYDRAVKLYSALGEDQSLVFLLCDNDMILDQEKPLHKGMNESYEQVSHNLRNLYLKKKSPATKLKILENLGDLVKKFK